jgi:hypothetical protein
MCRGLGSNPRVEVSSSNTVGQLDIRRCERQISRLHHCQRLRRSVSAQYCFSEKEHAEIARGRDPKPRPEIRSSHSAQACVLSGKRGGEARRGQAPRPCCPQGTDPQERSGSTQESARESRQVDKSVRIEEAPFGASFFLHGCQFAATPLAVPLGGIVRGAALRAFERFVLLRPRIVGTAALGDRRRRRNCGCRLRRCAAATWSQHRKLIERRPSR